MDRRGVTLPPGLTLRLSRVRDFAALGTAWRDLEARAEGSFFQGWTWTGCLAEERFSDPVLLEARAGEEIVALALFNRRRDRLGRERLYLGESGDSVLDSPYIEHNGVLVAAAQADGLAAGCLAAARRLPLEGVRPWIPRVIVASGVPAGLVHVCGGRVVRSHVGWRVDLAAVRRAEGGYLATRSANTRQQLRRSARALATRGPLSLSAARDKDEALRFLDQLVVFHQRSWQARGRPGAFAASFPGRFHRELVERGWARGEIGLWCVSSGDDIVAYLYNFLYRDVSLSYQSGFAFTVEGSAAKPGYTAHAMAIHSCAEEGFETYDFLAGDARYKRSLGDGSYMLHWVGPAPLMPGASRLAALARRARESGRVAAALKLHRPV